MQQNIIFCAYFLHAFPIAFRGGDNTAASRHGLKAQGANGFRPFCQNHLFNRVSGAFAVGFARQIPLGAVFQTMGNPHEAWRKGSVLGVALILATGGKRCNGGAVIITVTIQDLMLFAAIALMCDLTHHFKGFFIRLRSRVTIINPAHTRHFANQFFREQRPGDRAGRAREIVKLNQLVAHRVGNAFAPIADVNGPNAARDSVNMFFSVLIPNLNSLALDNNPRVIGFKRLVLYQVMPDMGAVSFDHMGNIVIVKRSVHLTSPCSICARSLGGFCFLFASFSLILMLSIGPVDN